MARVVVSMNRAGVNEVLHGSGPGGHVHRYVLSKARQTERIARRLAPKRSGRLASSISAGQIHDGPRVVRIAVSAYARRGNYNYALAQELGTGIYAGHGEIEHPEGGVFAFKPKRGRLARRTRDPNGKQYARKGLVVVSSYKGTPAVHYMANALAAVCGADPRLRLRYLRR